MSKRQIFLVYDCNQWKSRESMQLAMATTSVLRFKSFISQKIERGYYSYGNPDRPQNVQASEFRQEFGYLRLYEIDGKLTYGSMDYVYDGEEN